MAQTPFAETEALLAVMNADLDRARELVADMFPGERRGFAEQVQQLANLLGEFCDLCGEHLPDGKADTRLLMVAGRLSAHRECADVAIGSRDTDGRVTATREDYLAARRAA